MEVPSRSYRSQRGSQEHPWSHVAATTYQWVADQKPHNKSQTSQTKRWLFESSPTPSIRPSSTYQLDFRQWRDLSMECIDAEAEMWKIQQERAWKRAELKHYREKTRLIQEEVKRAERRVREKREAVTRSVVEAWMRYEERWSWLLASTSSLSFKDIPWPLVEAPRSLEDISSSQIAEFLFSRAHSKHVPRKRRIRNAQIRWHPDRFLKVLEGVKEEERGAVEAGAGNVARCLNDLMAEERDLGA